MHSPGLLWFLQAQKQDSTYLGGVEAVLDTKVDDIANGGRVQVHVSPQAEREQRRLLARPGQPPTITTTVTTPTTPSSLKIRREV